MKIVDLFSGIGGASLGFSQACFEPAFACDTDPNARLVYINNFITTIRGAIEPLKAKDIVHPQVLFAAPPNTNTTEFMRLLKEIKPRVLMLEFPVRMIDMKKLESKKQFELGEYRCWHRILNSNDFGLPQSRKCLYIVGFREDIRTPFAAFPFPDVTKCGVTLDAILESNPDQKLFLDEEKLKAIQSRNEKGIGFRTHFYTGSEICSTLPTNYYKDHRGILVDTGAGVRRLSVLECQRLMGFPDNFKLPVSTTESYRLLAQASCPPMIEAVAKEIKVWL